MGLADRDYMKSERWQREQRERLENWQRDKYGAPTAARRSRLARYALVAALALLPGALLAGYAFTGKAARPAEQPATVTWAGRPFTTKAQLARWLTAHGSSYRTWAKRHPEAAARLEGRAAPEST